MIPAIVHRIHLGPPQLFAEWCWGSSHANNPDWMHITHDDNTEWNMVGSVLGYSEVYAYKSDLMRLEALYRYGGIYIDTDVEVTRSFNPLINIDAPFAAWESLDTIGSAVIGAPAGHPEILKLIEYCIETIERDVVDSHIEYSHELDMFSPKVLTKFWSNNPNVLILPPASFYPYHWTEKDRASETYDAPYTYGVHHWNNSWGLGEAPEFDGPESNVG